EPPLSWRDCMRLFSLNQVLRAGTARPFLAAWLILAALPSSSAAGEPSPTVKEVRTASGAVWALQADGQLRVDGGPASWTEQASFALDHLHRAVLLDRAGTLSRSKSAYGNGGWDTLVDANWEPERRWAAFTAFCDQQVETRDTHRVEVCVNVGVF